MSATELKMIIMTSVTSECISLLAQSPLKISYIVKVLRFAFIRRKVRRGFCSPDLPCVEELVFDMDDKLFNCFLSDKHHVLYQLFPPERHCGYTFRPRQHELCLINQSRLDEQNFMY